MPEKKDVQRKKKMPENKDMLYQKIEAYGKSNAYPFHMPGHKRMELAFPNPYKMDITEIAGFDNLHHPQNVIKDLMERTARLYQSDKTYLLVNGSSGGNLAAIFAACDPGDNILIGRNSHRSIYNAIKIRELKSEYLYPVMKNYGIAGEVTPENVKEKLQKNPKIKAVVITSPTYEGIVSDVGRIVQIAHEKNIPVIVDAAHGSHFGFHEAFPISPVEAGADVVIMSLHKTLPAFTQTAVMHYKNTGLLSRERIEEYLGIFQTSSPSYIFMAGVDQCIQYVGDNTWEKFQTYKEMLDRFYGKCKQLQHLKIYREKDMDPSKIVITTGDSHMTGTRLSNELRQDYALEMEMESFQYVLAMTSIMDTQEGMDRLAQALMEIDQRLDVMIKEGIEEKTDTTLWNLQDLYAPREKVMELYEVERKKTAKELVPLKGAAGKVAGEEICLYPPGIPVIVPGERISQAAVDGIMVGKKQGLTVTGLKEILVENSKKVPAVNIVNF